VQKIKELTLTRDLDPETPTVVEVYEVDRTHTFLEERTDKAPSKVYVLRERDPEAVDNPDAMRPAITLTFHAGHHPKRGLNGWTTAALLEVFIDHVGEHQEGPFKCHENAKMLEHLGYAHRWSLMRRAAKAGGDIRHAEGVIHRDLKPSSIPAQQDP